MADQCPECRYWFGYHAEDCTQTTDASAGTPTTAGARGAGNAAEAPGPEIEAA